MLHARCRDRGRGRPYFPCRSRYALRVMQGVLDRTRSRALALCVIVAIASFGCDRGCGGSTKSGSASPAPGGASPPGSSAFDLGGTDCSDGLARCVDGRVEVSIAAHLPHPCGSGLKGEHAAATGACACPWRAAGSCATPASAEGGTSSRSDQARCAKDGVEVVATADVAMTQLCAPPIGAPVVRELLVTERMTASICADEGVRCEGGIVSVCTDRGQPARLIAACVEGCATGIGVDHGEDLTADGSIAILCRRAHAERR